MGVSLHGHFPPSCQVLEVGAGSSRLSEDMYKDGIKHITCTDLSTIAVNHMKERFANMIGPLYLLPFV